MFEKLISQRIKVTFCFYTLYRLYIYKIFYRLYLFFEFEKTSPPKNVLCESRWASKTSIVSSFYKRYTSFLFYRLYHYTMVRYLSFHPRIRLKYPMCRTSMLQNLINLVKIKIGSRMKRKIEKSITTYENMNSLKKLLINYILYTLNSILYML